MKPYWCFADNLVAEATEKVAKLSSSLSKATDNTAFPNNTIGSWIQPISAFLESRKGDFADESQKTAHHQGNLATEPPRHLILCETITSFAISLKSITKASERLENVLESPNRCIANLSDH